MTPARTTAALLALVLLATGCPTPPGEGAPGPRAPIEPAPDEPATEQATEPAAVDDAPPPPGPVGPAPLATPAPWEGRHQLGLLPKRSIRVGGVPVTAWIADNEDRRRLGLMHVREMPDDHGMLFVYPDVRERSFWMKNTFIPLSIAYIDERGRIATIVDMRPHDERGHPSNAPVRFGLEMNQGWFRRNGVAPGARVEGITALPGYE
ncbi:MAG: DUF192 domain-containing protein [Planctomycetes bacterium]|nr:DUF192 domain-containing protein [Planctomycetota bacterium]